MIPFPKFVIASNQLCECAAAATGVCRTELSAYKLVDIAWQSEVTASHS
jgi:hypothetical protein